MSGQWSGRKFIIAGHVYAGVRYKSTPLWHKVYAEQYFKILRDYHHNIIIEVMGHDHYADVRYHSSNSVLNLKDSDVKFDYHNLIVAPGITPIKGNNPGVGMFEISSDGVPSNLNFEFIDLVPTMGKSTVPYSDLKFLSLPMRDYGVTSITASAISDFRRELANDKDLTLFYLTRKMGYDAFSDEET